MSKGSPIVTFRLKEDDLEILDETVERNNETRKEELWTRSSWLRAAIEERLRHQERAKNQKWRRKSKAEKQGVIHQPSEDVTSLDDSAGPTGSVTVGMAGSDYMTSAH